MNESRQHGNYTVTCVFGNIGYEDRAGVIDFWRRNQALPPGESGEQRADQVLLLARDGKTGDVVGVSTVYRARLLADGPEYFMYRMFIQPDHRTPYLWGFMCDFAYEALNQRYHDGDPVGFAFLTENPKLQKSGVMARLKGMGCEHLGRGPLGRDLWRKMFVSQNSHQCDGSGRKYQGAEH